MARKPQPLLALSLGLGLALLTILLTAPQDGLARLSGAASASNPVIGEPFLIAPATGNLTCTTVAYNPHTGGFLAAYEFAPGFFTLVPVSRHGKVGWDSGSILLFTGERPALAFNSAANQFLLVYQEADGSGRYNIKGARLDGDGQSEGTGVFTITARPWHQQNPAVAWNQHGAFEDFLVVWEDVDPTWVPQHWEIWGQRVAGTHGTGELGGQLIGSNFVISASVNYLSEPDLAYNLNRNEYLVVYTSDDTPTGSPTDTDIYGTLVTAGGGVLVEHAIDETPWDQSQPAIAAYRLNYETPYLVVYDDTTDPQGSVWGRLVFTDGRPVPGFLDIATVHGTAEIEPDIASDEALGGYTVVWSQYDNDWDIYGRRVSGFGAMYDPFVVSHGFIAVVGMHERGPSVAGGAPVALAVWEDNGWGNFTYDIAGRLLGYRIQLPLVLRGE
jgi:hypothetical protein